MRKAEEILDSILAERERCQTNILRDEALAAIEQAQREAIEEGVERAASALEAWAANNLGGGANSVLLAAAKDLRRQLLPHREGQ